MEDEILQDNDDEEGVRLDDVVTPDETLPLQQQTLPDAQLQPQPRRRIRRIIRRRRNGSGAAYLHCVYLTRKVK